MLCTMIITAAYEGNLLAFLTTPEMTTPIRTVEELVENNLPWNMVLYRESVEDYLNATTDPVLKKFWEQKEAVEHISIPYERVIVVIIRRHWSI